MKQIYLDNASTSYPKPQEVAEAVYAYMTGVGSNIGRGGYASAYAAEEAVFAARQLLCDFFGGEDAKNVVFTKNITESLNVLIRGLLRPGDHVLVSSMEAITPTITPVVIIIARSFFMKTPFFL